MLLISGRRSAQNKLITVLNADNSVSLLSTRKGKTAKHAKNNTEVSQEDLNAKAKLQVSVFFSCGLYLYTHAHVRSSIVECLMFSCSACVFILFTTLPILFP